MAQADVTLPAALFGRGYRKRFGRRFNADGGTHHVLSLAPTGELVDIL